MTRSPHGLVELGRLAHIVLDLMLPGVDGLEVARRVRTFSDAYP